LTVDASDTINLEKQGAKMHLANEGPARSPLAGLHADQRIALRGLRHPGESGGKPLAHLFVAGEPVAQLPAQNSVRSGTLKVTAS
jgi:hypothetical protein